MSKKNYILLAKAINKEVKKIKTLGGAETGAGLQVMNSTTQNLCDELRNNNEKFNSTMFLKACFNE